MKNFDWFKMSKKSITKPDLINVLKKPSILAKNYKKK